LYREWVYGFLPTGKIGGDADSASVIADTLGTIPYEIICAIKKRVPRILA
jgi:alanine racemase